MKKNNLLLLTTSFPFGKGEKSFILPELPYLIEKFDITIVSSASKEEKNNHELETELPDCIKVKHYSGGFVKRFEVILYLVSFLLYKGSWEEVFTIVKSRKQIFLRLKKSLYFFASAKKFERWLDKSGIVNSEKIIIYSYWYVHLVLSIIMMKKKYPQIRIVTRAHGYDLYEERNEGCWQPYKTVMDSFADKVFFISKHGYDYYIEHFARNSQDLSKYEICRLGTASQKCKAKKKRNDSFLLVSCSNIVAVKRVELIIDALALIHDCNIRWVHFGDGNEGERIRVLAQSKLYEKENIIYEFKGHMANSDILKYYETEQPDCFIMTSLSEGSPVAMQEAISFGIPIIGTAVGGISEMIDGNGILLSTNPSQREVADSIQKMYCLDEDAYSRMRQRSYQIWEADYHQSKNCNKFVRILMNL